MALPEFTESGAEFYDEGRRRVHLWRVWDWSLPSVLFIGQNPSKAGAETTDPTVTKDVHFAVQLGFGSYSKVNLYDWIDTDPDGLLTAPSPAGDPRNITTIAYRANQADRIICCWGDAGQKDNRAAFVLGTLWDDHRKKMFCFGRTKKGCPKHTSRIAYATPLVAMLQS